MRCSKCRGELPAEAFAANRRAVIGRQAYCKQCFRAYLKDRRIAMKQKRIETEDSCPESSLYIFTNDKKVRENIIEVSNPPPSHPPQ